MTKTILGKLSLTREHENALKKATSKKHLKKILSIDKKREERFDSIRNNKSNQLSYAMSKSCSFKSMLFN